MKSFKEEITSLFNSTLQLLACIGVCCLITDNMKQAFGFGYIICLLWWKLDFIITKLKKY